MWPLKIVVVRKSKALLNTDRCLVSLPFTTTTTTTADGETRDDAIATNHRLRHVRERLETEHETARGALLTLHTQYNHSKTTWNVFTRYNLLKAMIKVRVRVCVCVCDDLNALSNGILLLLVYLSRIYLPPIVYRRW